MINPPTYLQQPVEWDDLHQEKGEMLKHGQNAVDYPVGEPSGVVFLCAGFDCFHGNVRRISYADSVAQDLCGIAEGQIENHNGNTTCGLEREKQNFTIASNSKKCDNFM